MLSVFRTFVLVTWVAGGKGLTAVDVAKVLKDSWQAVLDSEVPKEYREIAFNRAVDLYGYAPVAGQPPITPPEGNRGSTGSEPSDDGRNAAKSTTKSRTTGKARHAEPATGTDAPSEEEFYARIVAETGVDRELLEDVLHYSPTKPTIIATGRQLGSTLKQKQVAVALVLSVARQHGLGENVTSVAVIREACESKRCADRNLSQNIRDTKGLRLVGEQRTKDIQVRDAALDLFRTEVERIAGGGGNEPDSDDGDD